MDFKVIHDMPGRIRLRCGKNSFNLDQSYSISSFLSQLEYVEHVSASHITGSVLIYYKKEFKNDLLKEITNIQVRNLAIIAPKDRDSSSEIDYSFRKTLFWMIGGRIFRSLFMPIPVRTVLTAYNSVKFIKRGLSSLLNFKVDVSVLDGTAVGILVAQRSYSTASSVMFLLNVSDLLEDYTRKKSKAQLTRSLAINVDNVWLVKDDVEVSIPLAKLALGDVIVIRTGGIIPIDGTVTQGHAMVNQSSMTGEFLSVSKTAGSTVFAGTVVEDGSIKIEVKALSNETRINTIIDLINASEGLKAGIQSRAEKLADSIVPCSFLAFAAIFLFTGNINKALSVLLVDYSCAIKLSTPISVISAMREASNHKIMVKGGKFLEAVASADTIVFDKTGTLTVACPSVVKVFPFEGYTREEVLRTAACLEEHFPHSVARAVVRKALEEELEHTEEHADIEYILAHGISSTINNTKVLIGSYHFIVEDEKIPITEEQKRLIDEESEGNSVIFLAIGNSLAGFLCISDPVRPEAASVIQRLKKAGIKNVVMLTGDGEAAASIVAQELGIDSYESQVLPDDKARIISRMKESGQKIIMVGDGVNDSPALAVADVSISMKDSSDIAREVSDISLLSSDLNELVTIRELSESLMKKINNNYRFIISFNSSVLMLSLLGIITPSTSALLHNIATMSISARSMRPCLEKQADVRD